MSTVAGYLTENVVNLTKNIHIYEIYHIFWRLDEICRDVEKTDTRTLYKGSGQSIKTCSVISMLNQKNVLYIDLKAKT